MTDVRMIRETYAKHAVKTVREALSISNPMAVPRIEKVVVNVGIGKIGKDTKKVEEIVEALTAITGQKPVFTKARKAIAGFKTREGMDVGIRVTLHGKRMWEFLDRLVHTALPRVRDFQGLPESSVDESGNASIGIREHSVFPEIVPERVQYLFPFQVTVTTTAHNRAKGLTLFRALGFPLRQANETER
jgi:large subunit ribosomal protein L5